MEIKIQGLAARSKPNSIRVLLPHPRPLSRRERGAKLSNPTILQGVPPKAPKQAANNDSITVLMYYNGMDTHPATLYDPATGQALAAIKLLGRPIETGPLAPGTGSLQRFVILAGTSGLRKFWLQKEMLGVQPAQSHQYARLVTFPEPGEKQALLRWQASL